MAAVSTGATRRRRRRVAAIAGVAVCAVLAGAARLGRLPGGPEPPIIPEAQRGWVTLATLAIAAAGFAVAFRFAAAGGLVAVLGGVLTGGVAAFEHPLPAVVLASAAILLPGLWLLITGCRRRLTRVAGLSAAGLIGAAAGVATFTGYDLIYGATHPASTFPGPPDGAVEWVWVGAVNAERATLRAKVAAGDGVALRLEPQVPVAPPTRAGDIVTFSVAGLRPDTRYRYAVMVKGRDDGSGTGAFRTYPRGAGSFTIAFSSCARTGSNGAVFDAMRAEEPLLYLNTGDMYYANIESEDDDRFRRALDRVLTRPAQANLVRSAASAYVWDDHDYGGNDADGTSPSRPAAHRVYREYVPHYPLALAGTDTPIAQGFTIGRVRILVTDTRSARTPKSAPDGPAKTMLGAQQRAWLEQELVAASGRFPVILWVNPDPWIGEASAGSDTWSGYAHERRALADVIARNRIRGLVMLSGDSHAVAIDDGTNTDYATGGGGGFPLIHAGALDRPPESKGGPYSHGVFRGGGKYGTVIVDDDGGSTIGVTLTGKDWRGEVLTRLRLRFPAVSPRGG